MDFYVSMPEKYDSIEEFLTDTSIVVGTIDSTDVIERFPIENRILKFKGVPIDCVKRYLTLDSDNTNSDTAEFKDFKQTDKEKKFNFIKFNDYRIFELEPSKYIDKITVVDDTPDETGYVDRRKDDDMGVLEDLDFIVRQTKRENLIEKIDRLYKKTEKKNG